MSSPTPNQAALLQTHEWMLRIQEEEATPGKAPAITIGAYWGMIEDVARAARIASLEKVGG